MMGSGRPLKYHAFGALKKNASFGPKQAQLLMVFAAGPKRVKNRCEYLLKENFSGGR